MVDSRVLIPRPETEELVEKAIKQIKEHGYKRVLDLCTGSGTIGHTIYKETGVEVVGVDISSDALTVARLNGQSLNSKMQCIESNLFDSVEGKFDLIISNPPYIPSSEIEGLDKKVKDFEPKLALDGGQDGLDLIRKIAIQYKEYLNDNGVLMFEFGIGQAEEINKIFEKDRVEIIKDIEGIDRIAIVRTNDTNR